MSRIGKKPILLPAGVTTTIDGHTVTVKGPKGELTSSFNQDLTIKLDDGYLVVTRPTDERRHRALHGLTRALLNNMVEGVSKGFEIILEIQGVGYKGEVRGKNLVLNVGYSHEIAIEPKPDMSFEVPSDSRGQVIIVRGINKQEVGEMAAFIRKQRPPEPYQGKGIRYRGEHIIRKAGKTGKA
ncbi:MAG: 50S ribosomal protein L6 [Anaerolineae bacterium]|jgi:large subunit ribosomal protein L6|nr:50S ribosomal protein L6 [Anaerolineae bacterium]